MVLQKPSDPLLVSMISAPEAYPAARRERAAALTDMAKAAHAQGVGRQVLVFPRGLGDLSVYEADEHFAANWLFREVSLELRKANIAAPARDEARYLAGGQVYLPSGPAPAGGARRFALSPGMWDILCKPGAPMPRGYQTRIDPTGPRQTAANAST